MATEGDEDEGAPQRRGLRQARIPEALVEAIVERRCVLFVGAGFSIPWTQVGWDGLMATLHGALSPAERAGWDRMDALDRAQRFVDCRGRAALEDHLKATIPREQALAAALGAAADPARDQRQALVSLPFPYIFTTNYDAAVELLLSRAHVPHTVVVDDDQVLVDYPSRLRRVVKVHGDLELSDTIILARDDYLGYTRIRPGMYRLWQSLLVSHTLLFYGFGLTDPNFRMLFHDLASLLPMDGHRPRAWAFMQGEADARVTHWRRRGLHIIESRTFEAQARKVTGLIDRVRAAELRRDSLPHLLDQLAPTLNDEAQARERLHEPPEGLLDDRFLVNALRPATARLRGMVDSLWSRLDVPEELRAGDGPARGWDGASLVDVPPRDPVEEDRAELLFHALRALRRISPALADLDGRGSLGPPVSALLGALLYRAQRWPAAVEALEEARFWYEARIGGLPWWLGRLLGRAARRAGDRPSAYEFLLFCVRAGQRHAPGALATASDAALLLDVTVARLRRLQELGRAALAREIAATVLEATAALVPWLLREDPSADLYTRRTRGYGAWHLAEALLLDGALRATSPAEVVPAAEALLRAARAALPRPEQRAREAALEGILAQPAWRASALTLRAPIAGASY